MRITGHELTKSIDLLQSLCYGTCLDVLITIVFVPFIVHRFVSQSVMVSLDIERKLLFRQHTNCEASTFADKVVIAALIDLLREGFNKLCL